jgi:DnaA regulatory inactivator Hda
VSDRGTTQAPEQLTFRLPHRPALGRDDFLVAEPNRAAVAWIDAWPHWPQPALALTGPAGSGKSHLARVWSTASGARSVDARALARREPRQLLDGGAETPRRACLIDDADWLFAELDAEEQAELERRLLHLYNALRERGGHLLLTARTPPRRWPLALADLASRLRAAPVAELQAPDDHLLQALLVKQFADRQQRVPPEVVRFLWPRMERSFEAVAQLVDALDRAALATKSGLTVPLARRVLAELWGDDTQSQEPGETPDGSGNRG